MLLFLDESGTDHGDMPYQVVGGIAIREQQLWRFVQDLAALQQQCFGGRLRELCPEREFKAKQLRARDKFRYAAQGARLSPADRARLALAFLQRGRNRDVPRRPEFTAYGQACLTYVEETLGLCGRHDVKVFATIADRDAPVPSDPEALRRDMSFLFERYYYYLEDLGAACEGREETREVGLIVFDELERAQCRRVIGNIEAYFLKTQKGQERSRLIIPEPFFVHSDLTTGVQVADVVVYVIAWAYRYGNRTGPVRPELGTYCKQIRELLHVTRRPDADRPGVEWPIWSVKYVDDLRARHERGA
ncbi:MAG: DUF3800 domain-containing protein [Armatimonadetes bacterium]|nr:DUF3800 domain-containing protein [Armatimonadota bacterium]